MTPLLQLDSVSRRFVRKPDMIEKVAGWLGADVAPRRYERSTVCPSALRVAKWSDWWASRVAANPHWAA